MSAIKTKDITIGGILLGLMSVFAWKLDLAGVSSITLQTFFVILIGIILKPIPALLTVSVYVVAGIIGLPIFAGFVGGIGIFSTPTWGFLISFPIATIVISLFKELFGGQLWKLVIYGVIATLITYIGGSISLNKIFADYRAVWVYMVMYIPFDIVKMGLAITVGYLFNKRVLRDNSKRVL